MIMSGPIQLATGTRGLAVQYHPFIPVNESPQLRAIALDVWQWLRPQLDSTAPPPFVVFMATTARAQPAFGIQQNHQFNYVLERHDDGRWYLSGEAQAVP
jgi:hypothetical protein